MNLTFTYATVDCPNLPVIIKELTDYINQWSRVLEPHPQPFHHLPVYHVKQHCPSVFQWFDHESLTVVQAAVIRVNSMPEPSIHIDDTKHNLALNFGLIIPDGSYTAIYKLSEDDYKLKVSHSGSRAKIFHNAEEIDRFDLKQPTLFNLQLPHGVSTPVNTERLSISFRFSPDPWHLIR